MTAAAEVELDLATVKQLTQQVRTFGFDTAEDPIYQWRLEIDPKKLESDSSASALFPINHSELIGQLNLTCRPANDSTYDQFELSLMLTEAEKGKAVNRLSPFQLFFCKYKYYGDAAEGQIKEEEDVYFESCLFPKNAFKNELIFNFEHNDAKSMIVELYQEPLATINYRSPYSNMVVGKIEKFNEMERLADSKDFLFASPRFYFGSPDQVMVVRFGKYRLKNFSQDNGLFATLHILSEGESRGPPFSFTATFTIFSQKENGKDLVHKVFFRRDENKSEYSMLLVFCRELNLYLEDDTLYYKVLVEPRLVK